MAIRLSLGETEGGGTSAGGHFEMIRRRVTSPCSHVNDGPRTSSQGGKVDRMFKIADAWATHSQHFSRQSLSVLSVVVAAAAAAAMQGKAGVGQQASTVAAQSFLLMLRSNGCVES